MQMTAKEKWNFDNIKNSLIENSGIHLKIIWENDYLKSPKKAIREINAWITNTLKLKQLNE